jgi:hypothetical protein
MQFFSVLVLPACVGTLGLLSGTEAISVGKGSRNQAVAEIVFSVSVPTLSAGGVYLAYIKSRPGNILGGILTFYMIATAWMATQRSANGDFRLGCASCCLGDWIC